MQNVSFPTNTAVLLAVNPIDDAGVFVDVESTRWTAGDPQRLFFDVPTGEEVAAIGPLPEGVSEGDLVFAQFYSRDDRTPVENCEVEADARPGEGERLIRETFTVTPLAPQAAALATGLVGTVAVRTLEPPSTEPPPVEVPPPEGEPTPA